MENSILTFSGKTFYQKLYVDISVIIKGETKK